MSQKSVKFHIENNDYFGTLATVLSMIRQTYCISDYSRSNEIILNKLEKDLLFIQNKYKIVIK